MLDEHMKYPKWQKPYLAALMEVKQPELSAKVEAAEAGVAVGCVSTSRRYSHATEKASQSGQDRPRTKS